MIPGTVIDGRFVIERTAGQGAFGTVFRALDNTTEQHVAVKVLSGNATDFVRFEREAEVLASVAHPQVVSYVAHGMTDAGAPYLAMEWLDGIDLASRLQQGPLPRNEALVVAMRAALGLGAAHALGIVHRDVKPSNLFLVGARPDGVRVIDFGVARVPASYEKLTETGTVLGTPAYMAPEQARGAGELTPRADVFSLGVVLFECLVGRRAYDGPNAHAVLAKILLSRAPPRLRDHHADMPAFLDALLARMLAHDPEERLADGGAVAMMVSGILSDAPASSAALTGPAVSSRSLRTHSTLLVRQGVEAGASEETAGIVASLGGEVRTGHGRALVASFALGTPPETVQRAARCALTLRLRDPSLRMVIVTTRRESMAPLDAVARDVDLRPADGAPGEILLDPATASYLERDYEIARSGERRVLVRLRTESSEATTALVGRARELAALEGAYAEIAEERFARLVLVLGEAGIGKSRLIDEFLTRLSERSPAPITLRAAGDRPTSTSPFAAMARLVRAHLGLADDPADSELAYIRVRTLHALEAAGLGAMDAEFLCELIGLQEGAKLRGAPRDPLLVADGYRIAWLSFLDAVLASGPLVLVVEDLHFVDPASVHLLDVTLAQLSERSLLVIGSARPEEAASVLAVLEAREPERVQLKPLRAQLAAEVVRLALPDASPELVDRVIERAQGNPLRLRELARLGVTDDTPASLFGAIEGRMERLPEEVRRFLRAASVFGLRFPLSGVAALLGPRLGIDGLAPLLRVAEAEWFLAVADRTGPAAEQNGSFLHGLVQEAVYATLPAEERAAAHAAAGRWLETRAWIDPSLIAWHFEEGAETEHALRWYEAAARAALGGRDLERAIRLTEQALRCRPQAEGLARVLLVRAEAAFMKGDTADGKRAAAEALGAARAGSLAWVSAAGLLITSAGQLGENADLSRLAERVRAQRPEAEAIGQRAVCLCRAGTQLFGIGERALARTLAMEAELSHTEDPHAKAWLGKLRASFCVLAHEYEAALAGFAVAVACHAAGGDARASCQARILKASIHIFAADFESAETELEVAEAVARRTGADYFIRWATYARGKILAQIGEPAAAREHLERVRRELASNPRMIAGTHIYLGLAALRATQADWAESEARAALSAHPAPTVRGPAFAVLARALALGGRAEEALEAATQAFEVLRSVESLEENESVVHLAMAEALHACGRESEARDAIQSAFSRLMLISRRFSRPIHQERFLQRVETHARTIQLAHQLGVSDSG